MTWGMFFYHASLVHIIGVGVVASATLVRPDYFLDNLGLDGVLIDGPAHFVQSSPATAFAVFGTYFMWMVLGAAVLGVIDLPARLTDWLGRAASVARVAPEPLGGEPVWYKALNLDRKNAGSQSVQMSVRMKNGDIYVGDLQSYPILPDSVESKDIRLGNSILYPHGDEASPIQLDFSNVDGGGVLLNTVNVSSIHYLFHTDYEIGESPNDPDQPPVG